MEDNAKQDIPTDLAKQLGSIIYITKFLDGRVDIWNFGKLLTAVYRERKPCGNGPGSSSQFKTNVIRYILCHYVKIS